MSLDPQPEGAAADAPSTLDHRAMRTVAILRGYFAERSELPGAVVFTCAKADEFNLAQVEAVPADEADATLAAIVAHYRERRATPRVSLTEPIPPMWSARLVRAGFVPETQPTVVLTRPTRRPLAAQAAVEVTRAATVVDVDRVSAIQTAAFAVPPALRAWDRAVAREHFAAGRFAFYLATLEGSAVGAAAVCAAEGATGVHGLATLPAARRRGVATALLARLGADARERGNDVLVLATARGGAAAAFYGCLGFRPVRTLRVFVHRR